MTNIISVKLTIVCEMTKNCKNNLDDEEIAFIESMIRPMD